MGMKDVLLRRGRAVDPLPYTAPTDEVLAELERELMIARGLAAILADRAKRAESRIEASADSQGETSG